jgi:hypothetical protein
MALATTLATADASTCEAMGQSRSVVGSGIAGGCGEALSDVAQPVLDEGRLMATDRLTRSVEQTWCGPSSDRLQPRVARTRQTEEAAQKSRSEQPAAKTVADGPTTPVPIARSRAGSIHRPHRRPQATPKVVPLYEPNDDTTSDDPDEDDDEPSKFGDDSEDTEVASIAWLEERPLCPSPRECAPLAWTAPPSSSLPTQQRLRC